MPAGKRKYGAGHTTSKRARAGTKHITKMLRQRRKGSARPMRSLSTGYKGAPNQYRFVRETRPQIIDLGDPSTPGVTLIGGAAGAPDICAFQFPGFQMDQLSAFVAEFDPLFANYKVDRIETVFIPQWEQSTQPAINPLSAPWTATSTTCNLMITRVNTKYLVDGLGLKATAEAQRDKLAQIQKKTRSLYGTKKWLKITTSNPDVPKTILDGTGGTNLALQASPWLSVLNASDQQFSFNDVLFADRLDGQNFAAGIWKYRMYHRVHFRTSFVG